MKIATQHISALEALGYTTAEAGFLYMVAAYSGYFLPRQFIAFTQARSGKRSHLFTDKLESRGHATWREYLNVGGVYHLCSKTLYRQIDRENLRNRRRHSTEFIRTRLILLDFILANQGHQYLETEQEKLNYFCREKSVPRTVLPAKSYDGVSTAEPTVRYFVDNFPLFLDSSQSPGAPVLTLSYVDPGKARLAGFRNHLHAYTPLFRHLGDFQFLYISNSSVHFMRAEQCFTSLVTTSLQQSASLELIRYFRLRAAWDAKQYGKLSNEDIEWLERSNLRFKNQDIEHLYGSWVAGKLTEEGFRLQSGESVARHSVRFATHLIDTGPLQCKMTHPDPRQT
jgi:hypothetical protein